MAGTVAERVAHAQRWMEAHGTRAQRAGLARFGITAERVHGVSLVQIRALAKELGRDQAVAEALWRTGWYEARLLAAFVGEPDVITPATMDAWTRDFDSWAVCDTACFTLFDRSPHAWKKVDAWSRRAAVFEKRAAFALLASIALHDRAAPDASFLERLPRIEAAAPDERNVVKKGVSWALRGIGARNLVLHAAALATARKLAESTAPAARWVGKDAVRDLTRPLVVARLERRAERARRGSG